MESRAARIISALLHPLLIPTYIFILLLNLPVYFSIVLPVNAKLMIIGTVLITTGFIPAVFIFFMLKKGLVTSIYMNDREERTFPYVIAVIFFYLTYYLLKRLQLSPVYHYFMAGATFLVIMTLLINIFWKISSHMVAMGAATGMIIGLSLYLGVYFSLLIYAMILLSGLVGFARLRLDSHTQAQVYTGYALGLITVMILFVIQG